MVPLLAVSHAPGACLHIEGSLVAVFHLTGLTSLKYHACPLLRKYPTSFVIENTTSAAQVLPDYVHTVKPEPINTIIPEMSWAVSF